MNYYSKKFPHVNDVVMGIIQNFDLNVGIYVTLPEYNNMEALVTITELTKWQVKNKKKLAKNTDMALVVVFVDAKKNYVDLSSKKLQESEAKEFIKNYVYTNKVYNLGIELVKLYKHYLTIRKIDIITATNDIFIQIIWPLFENYELHDKLYHDIVSDPIILFKYCNQDLNKNDDVIDNDDDSESESDNDDSDNDDEKIDSKIIFNSEFTNWLSINIQSRTVKSPCKTEMQFQLYSNNGNLALINNFLTDEKLELDKQTYICINSPPIYSCYNENNNLEESISILTKLSETMTKLATDLNVNMKIIFLPKMIKDGEIVLNTCKNSDLENMKLIII